MLFYTDLVQQPLQIPPSTQKRQNFFEDMLNKVVFIVHHGLVRPHDGARILHGCASLTGLSLIKELPNTTVAIQGLLKTNDLAQGHNMLVETFAPFGDIIDASIAPQNRGFGMLHIYLLYFHIIFFND